MSLTLFHYVHCPFCVRVRMTLGYLGLEYQSVVVQYDDEKTPTELTGKKMLPIMKFGDQAINESLDIMAKLDTENKLNLSQYLRSSDFQDLETLLSQVGSIVHSLAMPFWVWTAEFTPSAREYFKKKKEAKRGPFSDLVKNQSRFVEEIAPLLHHIEGKVGPYYLSSEFGAKDILLASHLWGLYSVPEFQFSEKLHRYLQTVKFQCKFNYSQPLLESF